MRRDPKQLAIARRAARERLYFTRLWPGTVLVNFDGDEAALAERLKCSAAELQKFLRGIRRRQCLLCGGDSEFTH